MNYHVITIIALSLGLITAATAQQQTFRDASGRVSGTATVDSNGTTTFRDASGRIRGTSTVDSNGTMTVRDARGRDVGTVQRAQ